MEITDSLKELFISFIDTIGNAVWIEILTESPSCTYYFGPFSNMGEAESAKSGYIEDLVTELATITSTTVKRCKPHRLTIFDDSLDTYLDVSPNERNLAFRQTS